MFIIAVSTELCIFAFFGNLKSRSYETAELVAAPGSLAHYLHLVQRHEQTDQDIETN